MTPVPASVSVDALRVGFDATPLLGRLTGIGHYARQTFGAIAALPGGPHLTATAFTLRGTARLPNVTPDGIATRAKPVPAQVLRAAWGRTELPPVEWLCGRVDVFHGTNFVLPPTRRAAGVVTVHDLSFLRYPETVSADSLRYRELVPRSVRRAAVVCALTRAMAEEISAEYGIAGDRIQVTHPGIDEAWFSAEPPDAAARARIGLPRRYLLAVGTLEPRKNLRQLVTAYARLRATRADVPPLVLAGPSGWGGELSTVSLPEGAVYFTGYLDDADLRSTVAGASCLAYPSRYEGFGLPPAEALACGVPVVATDLAVTREVLGAAARLVAPDDPDALSQALADALDDPRDAAADEARRAQARRWTWQGCAEATLDAYRRAVS
jgi:glycosyltransferase involved in cell wall biosynthesis